MQLKMLAISPMHVLPGVRCQYSPLEGSVEGAFLEDLIMDGWQIILLNPLATSE